MRKNRFFGAALFGWLFVVVVSRAEAKPKKFQPPPAERTPQAEMNLEASYERAEPPILVSVDVGIIDDQGMALPGLELTIAMRAKGEAPLYLGGTFGIFTTTAGGMSLVIPLLPEAFFVFETASKWRPILGLAAGPVFSTGSTLTPVRFGMFVVPGLEVTITHTLAAHFEARMGMIGSSYAYLPQVGITAWL